VMRIWDWGQRSARGKHAVGVCDDGAGARGRSDASAGGAGGGGGGHVQRAACGKHAVGSVRVFSSLRLWRRISMGQYGGVAPDIPGQACVLQICRS